jgi:hypothetical protein
MNINHKFWALFSGVDANNAAIAAEMRESGLTADQAVEKLANAGRLALNKSAQTMWQEHLAQHPDQRHAAGFINWAEGYAAGEEKREWFTLEMEFPHLIGKPIEVLRAEKQRNDLIDEICDLLRSPDGSGRGGRYSNFNLLAVRRQMIEGQWSLEKLIARRAEIVREQTLAAKPVAELKAMVKEHYNQPVAFPGFPALPERTYVRGQGWVTVDAGYLENLIHEDMFSFRRLVRLYGSPQVDHRRGLQ